MSDIERAQKEYDLTPKEARKLFREGELIKIESKREGTKIKGTVTFIYRTYLDPICIKNEGE